MKRLLIIPVNAIKEYVVIVEPSDIAFMVTYDLKVTKPKDTSNDI